MSNSFIENVNYVANLDLKYGDSVSFMKNNISFRGTSADIKLSLSYYDNTIMNITSIEYNQNNSLYSDVDSIINQFKTLVESSGYFNCTYSVSENNNSYLINEILINIVSNNSEIKIMELNFNMIQDNIIIYNINGDILNPLRILPHIASLFDLNVVNSIFNIEPSINEIINTSNNIDSINSVSTNIVPNLSEILQADENAQIAITKALEASISAANASSSETNTSVSETNAYNSEQNASLSEQAALGSEQSASSSASTATIQAYLATAKANEASISAANASASEANVQAMKLAVETIYDSFDDRFLGAFDIDPVIDNDGNPLLNGALYFNSSSNTLKVYSTGTIMWYNIPQIYLSSLLDVELTSISVGQILVWNGTKWTNSVITVGSGGYAANVYLTNLASTTNGSYKQVSYIPDIGETVINTVVNNNEVLAYAGIFDGDVKANAIPPGEWGFHFHRYVDNAGHKSRLRFEIFKRSSVGIDTSLFSIYSNDINDSVSTREDILITQPTYSLIDTDRIGIKIYASTNRTSDTIVSFKIGDGNATFFNTPLQVRHNQLRARDETDSHPSSSISVIPSGSLIDTDVQNALVNIYEKTSNIDNTSDVTKNVLSATKLTTGRTISLSGDIVGDTTFDGSGNVNIATTVQPNSVALGTDTTGNYVAGATAGTGISISGTAGEGWSPIITNTAPNVTTDITTTHNATNVVVNSSDGTNGTINGATQTLAGAMTAADKVKLDGIATGATANTGTVTSIATSGAITGGTITSTGTISHSTADGYLHVPATGTTNSGNVLTAGATAGSLSWTALPSAPVTSVAGKTGAVTLVKDDVGLGSVNNTADSVKNVLSATKLTTGRTISITGDLSWTSPLFDGSVNVTAAGILANSGVTAGTYTKVTVDAKGRATSGTTLSNTDIPNLDTAKLTTGTLPVARGGTGATTNTGSGSVVLSTSPVLVTPDIGVATGTSFNSITGLSSTNPLVDGTVAVGTSKNVARADHVHPTDTTRASLVSPAFTGTPTAPTAAVGTNTTQLATTAFVLDNIGSTPIGTIIATASANVPSGFLECNGATISRTVYAKLFAVIGTTFGVGDGSTTFNLPDLRGEFIRGWDNGRGIDTGRTIGSYQDDAYKSHFHYAFSDANTTVGTSENLTASTYASSQGLASGWQENYCIMATSTVATEGKTSDSGSTETRPKNIAMMYCIKY